MVVAAVGSLTNSRRTIGLLPRKCRLNDIISSHQTKDWSLEEASKRQQQQKGFFLNKRSAAELPEMGSVHREPIPSPIIRLAISKLKHIAEGKLGHDSSLIGIFY